MIKLFDPSIGKEEEITIKRVLTSKIWANGAGVGKVSEFESKFRKYTNSKNCIAVNSGTAALNLALSLYNIKDKEVIFTPDPRGRFNISWQPPPEKRNKFFDKFDVNINVNTFIRRHETIYNQAIIQKMGTIYSRRLF